MEGAFSAGILQHLHGGAVCGRHPAGLPRLGLHPLPHARLLTPRGLQWSVPKPPGLGLDNIRTPETPTGPVPQQDADTGRDWVRACCLEDRSCHQRPHTVAAEATPCGVRFHLGGSGILSTAEQLGEAAQ